MPLIFERTNATDLGTFLQLRGANQHIDQLKFSRLHEEQHSFASITALFPPGSNQSPSFSQSIMSSILMRRSAAAPRALRAFSTSSSRGLARISIIGHLADTPELQATSTGHEVLKYAVASNSGSKDNRHTSWFRVASFEPEGPRRDYLRTLPKGAQVFVEGDISLNTYEDAEGKTRSAVNIVQSER